jgi:VWFA-related protein
MRILVCALLSCLAAPAGQVALQTAAPARTTVMVDVVATDSRGRNIDTLKPGDFELREDGVLQTLDEVRFIHAVGRTDAAASPILSISDERAESTRPDVRLFAIFLDDYHVSADNSARVRSAVQRFVDEGLSRSDLVVVMRPLDSLLAIRLSRDREEARRIIGAFDGRKGDYAPRSGVEQSYIAGTPERVEQLRAQVSTSALNALAAHLGSLAVGRKTLLVVSEGLQGVDHHRGFDALPTIDSVIRAANRSNVAVYAVDPRPDSDRPSSEDTNVLRRCASVTGGRLVARADFESGIRSVASDSGGYYLLAYHAGDRANGAFHDLAVAVTRPGVTLRTRSGYWSPPPELRASLSESHSRPPEPPRRISPLINPWFGAARGADGKTRMTFVWEPVPRTTGERTRQPPASRIQLTALGSDGTVLFEGVVKPSGPLHPDAASESEARAVFEAPPGVVRLRMSIQSESADAIDTDVREIRVRDMGGPVVLGTPAVLRARTARDLHALESDPEAVPVAAREFSRAEHLMIRVPVYAAGSVSVSAKLLGGGGHAMRDLDVQTASMPGAPDQIDLSLAGLASGSYSIEVTASGTAGQVKDQLAFRVTS